LIGHIAIDHARGSALPQDTGVGLNFSVFDALKKIDFHFYGYDPGTRGGGEKCSKAPGRVRQHRQDSAVDHAVNLLVQFEHGHAEDGPAALSPHQLKSEVVDGMAVAQTFGGTRQRNFR
jgi:hypothetical protein